MDGKFRTTQWSLVHAAGDSANPEYREALSALCRTYWFPVYAYVRFRGNDSEAARELTQGFFAFLLDSRTDKDLGILVLLIIKPGDDKQV